MTKKLVLFDQLEDDKENYSYQRKGRSVSLISQLKTASKTSTKFNNDEYWKKILDQIYLVDDPLSLFIEYIETESHKIMSDWTSKKSDLLEINELCLLYCQRFDKYSNDPKYLNVWLDYCSNFYSNEDQIDIFYYMYRSNICTELSDFYSYFIRIFIQLERYSEAYQALSLGIQANAKPEKQLLDELKLLDRISNGDLSENSNLDNHLVFRINCHEPNLILNQERNDLIRNYQNRIIRNKTQRNIKEEKKKQGLINSNSSTPSIYRDEKSEINDTFNVKSTTFSSIDIGSNLKFKSRNEKFKENKHLITGRIEPNCEIKPLRHVATIPLDQSKSNNKLSIFNDRSGRNGPIYKRININGMEPEKIDCNFNLIYSKDGIEYSIEEILALTRYGKTVKTDTNNNKRNKNYNNSGNFSKENSSRKRMKV